MEFVRHFVVLEQQETEDVMRLRLHVESSGKEAPRVRIPNAYMWDFVEYLAFQRVHATYIYREEYVIATFPRMDRAGVQRLVDEWAACRCVHID